MPEQYVNAVSTTLAAAITTISQTSISVSSATGFPLLGNFRILVGTELMLVTSVSGTTWTVTRGIESTQPYTFTIGTTVDHILTAGALDAIRADISSTGTYANLPATGNKVGDIYVPTDSFYDFIRWNGSTWDHFRNGKQMILPINANYSWDNQGGSTISTTNGGIVGMDTSLSGSGLHVRYKSAPATPYSIYCGLLPHYISTNYNDLGLVFRDSTGKLATWSVAWANGWVNRAMKWTNSTTYNSDYIGPSIYPAMVHGPIVWMGLRDDGTNRSILYSANGVTWISAYTIGRTDFMTSGPNGVGFYWGDTASNAVGMTLLHWQETTP
jgi:hypothetical protein